MGRRRRRRVDLTDDWEQLELLCAWEEQVEYERIRPQVLFGEPVPERSSETGVSERTLYRRIAGFEEIGMESLFGSEPAKRRVLPPSVRRLIVDLKAEHPALNLNEIASICYVRTGRRHLPEGVDVAYRQQQFVGHFVLLRSGLDLGFEARSALRKQFALSGPEQDGGGASGGDSPANKPQKLLTAHCPERRLRRP